MKYFKWLSFLSYENLGGKFYFRLFSITHNLIIPKYKKCLCLKPNLKYSEWVIMFPVASKFVISLHCLTVKKKKKKATKATFIFSDGCAWKPETKSIIFTLVLREKRIHKFLFISFYFPQIFGLSSCRKSELKMEFKSWGQREGIM